MDATPCPFCKSPRVDVVDRVDQPGDAVSAVCSECAAMGPPALNDDEALRLWNAREPT